MFKYKLNFKNINTCMIFRGFFYGALFVNFVYWRSYSSAAVFGEDERKEEGGPFLS